MRNTVPVKQERGDPCCQDNLTHSLFEPARLLMTTPAPSTDDPAQEDLLQKCNERVEKAFTTRSRDKDLY